jgi:hypothetical protein
MSAGNPPAMALLYAARSSSPLVLPSGTSPPTEEDPLVLLELRRPLKTTSLSNSPAQNAARAGYRRVVIQVVKIIRGVRRFGRAGFQPAWGFCLPHMRRLTRPKKRQSKAYAILARTCVGDSWEDHWSLDMPRLKER